MPRRRSHWTGTVSWRHLPGLASAELCAYVDRFVAARAKHPGNDLTSTLLAAAGRGELSLREVSGMAYVLYTTAQLSTAAPMATALLRVLTEPRPPGDRPPADRD